MVRSSREREGLTRLRWRMRGAWLWPTFIAATLGEAVLLTLLPFYGDGPGGLVPAALIAGFTNLFFVAVVAPLIARRVRRVRPDLPKLIAENYTGTALVCAVALAFLAAGLLNRPAVLAERGDRQAQFAAVHDYVTSQAPAYRDRLASADSLRVKRDLYRTCVPGSDPKRWLCLFVETDQRPAGVTLDSDRAPNYLFQR